MKVKDIPRYTLRDWLPEAVQFAVATLNADDRRGLPHRNDFYEIYWITEGEARFTIDALTYTAKAHSLVFIAPGQVAEVSDIAPLKGWWIAFDEAFFCVKDEAVNRPKGINTLLFFNPDFSTLLSPDPSDEVGLASIVTMMQEECRGRGDQYVSAFFSLLQLFLIRVSRIMEREEVQTGEVDRPFLEFRHLIGEHYREKKNVSDYARLLNMTPVCLNALSKSMSGLTAGEQIRGHVILEAKRLLHNTDLSAKEIAYRLGFEDAPYFSRFFKKYTGQTLLEFREQSRKVPY
jgi:AraC family transcriptional regulator, transcriptional activator of pobA